MVEFQLNQAELQCLAKQDPETKADGGFQSLMVDLQKKVTPEGKISLSEKEIERIKRYACKYNNGGWEDRLKKIFGRHIQFSC